MTKLAEKTEYKEGYKKTKLGWIPEDWDEVKLSKIVKESKSGLSRKLSDKDIGLPVIRSNNLINNDVDFKEIKYWYIEDNQGANTSNYFLCDGDILLNFINSLAQIGKCSIYQNKLNRNVIFTTNLMRIRLNENVLPKYFLFHTKLRRYNYHIQSIAKPAVNQASFTGNDYKKYKIPLPPLSEQEKIAEVLTSWDNAIEKTEKLIEFRQKCKKALMQSLLTGKLRFPEFAGQKWQKLKSKEVFKSFSKKNNGNEELLSATQEFGVIPRSMLDGRVTMPDGSTEGYKLVEKGDFVISLRSFQGGIEYSEYRGIVSPAYTILKNILPIDKQYYRYWFKSSEFIARLSVAVIGIRDGKQISFEDFGVMPIYYPPIEEQQKIAAVLNTCDREIEILKQKLNKLNEQKKGLMQKLLTGQVRVKV